MIPGISDIYELSDWLKKEYIGPNRTVLLIEPTNGGTIKVSTVKEVVDATTNISCGN